MLYIVIFGSIGGVLVMWIISTQRALAMLDENISSAMSQISVQISGRWDALSILIELTKDYDGNEYKILSETIKARRHVNVDSKAKDAVEQDNLQAAAMNLIVVVAEQYPALKTDQIYQKTMDSVNQYRGMLHQSRLVYNAGVAQLNRRIRMFPTSLVAVMFDFKRRGFLE